ncbi:MAG: metal-dependent hydrolase [Patescibacteria group bacterium]
MASFRTHMAFGVAFGVMSAVAIASLAVLPPNWSLSILIGLAVTLGAQLPDIDSDSGLPFHITFGSLALSAGGLSLLYAIDHYPGDYLLITVIPLLAIFAVWVILGTAIKKFTRHRGMAHSLPAAILAGLITFRLMTWLDFAATQAACLGLAISLGYTLHLILDEVWAGMNFHGQLFVPNKAFGSALKLISHDHKLTVLTYFAIALMLTLDGQLILTTLNTLVNS